MPSGASAAPLFWRVPVAPSAGVPTAWQITDYVRSRHPEAYAAASGHDYPSVMLKLPWQSRYALFHNLVRVAGLIWAHLANVSSWAINSKSWPTALGRYRQYS